MQVTDVEGNPIEGYSFDEAIPFAGDRIDWQPVWKEGRKLSELAGKPLQIGVRLQNARLYAMRGDFVATHPRGVDAYLQTGIEPTLPPGF